MSQKSSLLQTAKSVSVVLTANKHHIGYQRRANAFNPFPFHRMIPLRTVAMLNNVLGVAVGIGTVSLSTFIEHAVNLPLNAARLREMRRLITRVREASETDLRIDWLKPFMYPRELKAGDGVVSKGDEASEAFVLVEGRIVISEKSLALEPGAHFGEMALFTAAGRRTASAVCVSDVKLLVITDEQFEQLYSKIRNSASISFVSSCAASREIMRNRTTAFRRSAEGRGLPLKSSRSWREGQRSVWRKQFHRI